ncbi:MAG: recombinase family protein [Lachnospiraceae bacterium]|nr:recombinase family protein [Lachnospiraceae bacterium]
MKYKYILAYLRLSQDDLDKTDESNSIQNQRLLIQQFVNQKEDLRGTEILYFVDDGYTGTNFERPGFMNMMEELSSGENYCIVVKDFSRLGRDTLQTQNYIEKVFPFMGIRLISINDFFDSSYDSQDAVSTEVKFKNLINGIYPEICSKNVKQALYKRAEKGLYKGSIPPFGYCFYENDNTTLKIDKKAAEIVRIIFDLRLKGKKIREIARLLNEENVVTPSNYMKNKGLLKNKVASQIWTDKMVRNILYNIVYTGSVENHKSEVVVISQKKSRNIPKEKRICVPDRHEPIISMEEYEKVNAMACHTPNASNKKKEKYKTFFDGKIRCGCCQRKMRIRAGEPRHKNASIYCKTKNFSNEFGCYPHGYKIEYLEQLILELIRKQAECAEDRIQVLDVLTKTTPLSRFKMDEQLLENTLKEYKNKQMIHYDDYVSGRISREEFLKIKEEIKKEEETYKKELSVLIEKMSLLKTQEGKKCELEAYSKCSNLERLSYEIVQELIEEIIFYNPNHIEVKWKFKDDFIDNVSVIKDDV